MRTSTTRRLLMTLSLSLALLWAVSFASAQATAPAEDDRAPAVAPQGPAQPAQPAQVDQPADQQPTTGPADGQETGKRPAFPWQMIALIAAMFLLFFWMGRKPKKEEQRRREMLANLKKGDKITTIGGIVGSIIEVRDDEIVVKVDEGSNTRMRFARWAIRQVGEPKADEEKK